MKRFTTFIFLFFALLAVSACRKDDPNPELMDPIYQDLSKRAADAQKGYEDEIASQASLRISEEKAEANSPELRNSRRSLQKSEAKSVDLQQMALYYKIRTERRLFVDRISYKEAIAKGEKWPDPHEYSDYQVNIRLREAPRNWGVRVPKLQDRLASAHAKSEKAKESPKNSEE